MTLALFLAATVLTGIIALAIVGLGMADGWRQDAADFRATDGDGHVG